MDNVLMFLYSESVCENIIFLQIIWFIKNILKVAFFLIPIIMVVMISIDFFKNVMAPNEDDMKKNLGIAIKRILFAVILFLVPTIVNLFVSIVDDANEGNDKFAKNFKKCYDVTRDSIKTQKEDNKDRCDEDSNYKWNSVTSTCNKIASVPENNFKDTGSISVKDKKYNDDNSSSSSSSSSSSIGTPGTATGFLKSPINVNDTNEDMIKRVKSNSKTLYYLSGSYHGGTDVPVSVGTNVLAMDGGTVYKTGSGSTGYGKYIVLEHKFSSKSYYTLYGHLSKISVSKNDKVAQGQKIGESGNTGNSTGPHLHIELDTNGNAKGHTDNCTHILTLDYIGMDKKYTDAIGYCKS